MANINPAHYQSVSDYLAALSFTIDGDRFIKGSVTIPVSEIIGFTPMSFHNKAKAKGWLDMSALDEEHPMSIWGDQFVLVADWAVCTNLITWNADSSPTPIIAKLLSTLGIA